MFMVVKFVLFELNQLLLLIYYDISITSGCVVGTDLPFFFASACWAFNLAASAFISGITKPDGVCARNSGYIHTQINNSNKRRKKHKRDSG
jgi:hypothetical protein